MAKPRLVSKLAAYVRRQIELRSPHSPAMIKKQWPASYTASRPQRYFDNHHRYIAAGGKVRVIDDVRGFVAGTPGNCGDMSRYFAFCLIFDQIIKEVPQGDFAELGVYKGNTATLIATHARRLGRTAYLLDTFEGFAEQDLQGIDANKRMEFSDTSLEAVQALVGDQNVRYIKGNFPQSASQLPHDGRYCLVHLDCDLYAPMKSALEYFFPRIVPGGFLILHDYSSLHWDGAELAVDEFFADKVECPIPIPDGAGSVIVRKAKNPDRVSNWFVQSKLALADQWHKTSHGQPGTAFLGGGWSSPESWGVWGLGDSHELRLYVQPGQGCDIILDLACQAALVATRTYQQVDVFVQGNLLSSLEFTANKNQGLRTVIIPAGLVAKVESLFTLPVVAVQFRPHSLESPAELGTANADTRPLGLGLSAVRMTFSKKRN